MFQWKTSKKKKSHWILIAAHLIRPINTARLRSFNVTARLFSKRPSSVWTASTYLHDMRNDTNCIKPQKVSVKRLICFQSAVVIVSRRNLGGGGTTAYSLVVIRAQSSWSQTDATILSQGPAEMEMKKINKNVRLNILVKFLRFRTAELKLRRSRGVMSVDTGLAVLPQQVLSYQLEVVCLRENSLFWPSVQGCHMLRASKLAKGKEFSPSSNRSASTVWSSRVWREVFDICRLGSREGFLVSDPQR